MFLKPSLLAPFFNRLANSSFFPEQHAGHPLDRTQQVAQALNRSTRAHALDGPKPPPKPQNTINCHPGAICNSLTAEDHGGNMEASVLRVQYQERQLSWRW